MEGGRRKEEREGGREGEEEGEYLHSPLFLLRSSFFWLLFLTCVPLYSLTSVCFWLAAHFLLPGLGTQLVSCAGGRGWGDQSSQALAYVMALWYLVF